MLGGTSALVSFTFSMATATKRNDHEAEIDRESRAPFPMIASRPMKATMTGMNVETVLPMPLMPWAKLRLRLYPPSSLTSRMIGLPATCRNVVPMPSTKMQASKTA